MKLGLHLDTPMSICRMRSSLDQQMPHYAQLENPAVLGVERYVVGLLEAIHTVALIAISYTRSVKGIDVFGSLGS